jgi:mono/diheme cytochrome c family protein
MGARRLARLGLACWLALAAGQPSCRRGARAPSEPRPDWDRAAFVLQLVRHEYREQAESGDQRALPALLAAIDGARAAIASGGAPARWLDGALGELREAVVRHDPPRAVARRCTAIAAQLSGHGIRLAMPAARPDLQRGASLYRTACAPCHGPPAGPPPASAAHLVPPPPPVTESALTPYELFTRITYGGAGTAMPSFADTLAESARWDIAFHLFADRWPPCTSPQGPRLSAAAAAHLSDYDIWKTHGYGAAACLRRNFR